jgi:hypothetical protein
MKIPKIPREFWDDVEWTRSHHTELLNDYRSQWVAVIDKKVIAAGDNLEEVESIAKKKTGKCYVFTMFIDGAEHIYGAR